MYNIKCEEKKNTKGTAVLHLKNKEEDSICSLY